MKNSKYLSLRYPMYILIFFILNSCTTNIEAPGNGSAKTASTQTTVETRQPPLHPTSLQTEITNTATYQVTLQNTPPTHPIIQTLTPSIAPTITPLPTTTSNPTGWQSYILFERSEDTWIASPDGSDIRMIAQGYVPIAWSPSGLYLLLYREGGVYIAEADGSNPRLVYQRNQNNTVYLWWVTDDWVLVEVRPSVLESFVSYLKVATGELITEDPDYERIIEAVSPTGEFWFQHTDIGFEIADLAGNRTVIEVPGPGGEPHPMFYPNLVFTPWGDAIIHLGCFPPISIDTCYLFRSWIQNYEVVGSEILLPEGGDEHIISSSFQVSPDGQYVAIIYSYYPQVIIKFFNLQSLTIDYEWNYPGPPSQPVFFWSPDSDMIAVVYNNIDEGRVHGIVTLNMTTGESQIITDGTINDFMKDWRYVDLDD